MYNCPTAGPRLGNTLGFYVGNPILFAGMRQDPATGMCYDRDRWYDPSTGGFSSTDPARSDANLYDLLRAMTPPTTPIPAGCKTPNRAERAAGAVRAQVPCGPYPASAYTLDVPTADPYTVSNDNAMGSGFTGESSYGTILYTQHGYGAYDFFPGPSVSPSVAAPTTWGPSLFPRRLLSVSS